MIYPAAPSSSAPTIVIMILNTLSTKKPIKSVGALIKSL